VRARRRPDQNGGRELLFLAAAPIFCHHLVTLLKQLNPLCVRQVIRDLVEAAGIFRLLDGDGFEK
jgi:hypothetical protein